MIPIPKMTRLKILSFPWIAPKLLKREVVTFSSLDELPPEARVDRDAFVAYNMKSHIFIPLSIGGSGQFALAIGSLKAEKIWPPKMASRLRLIGEILINALDRKRREEELHQKIEEIKQLEEQTEAEVRSQIHSFQFPLKKLSVNSDRHVLSIYLDKT